DENGGPTDFEEFMPNTLFRHPHDMAFGPDGNMYLIEWGLDFNYAGAGVNPDSGLYKISYTKCGRTPVAEAHADVDSGQAPLQRQFCADESYVPDGAFDSITWECDFGDGTTPTEPNPTHTFTEPGVYSVRLTVSDTTDRSSTSNITITV